MEATLIIKLPDGSTKTLELENVNVGTTWGAPNGFPTGTVYDLTNSPPFLVCSLSLTGQVKDSSLNTAL